MEAAAFGREDEALIVEAVRTEGAALLELVAEEEGEIVGHILFSRMTTEPVHRFAGLAPVAVAPDQQGRGWGEALCRAGIERCAAWAPRRWSCWATSTTIRASAFPATPPS
ncbi:MAG: GNAT family N-acetyltransferase [Caulobacteraceae bacterium]